MERRDLGDPRRVKGYRFVTKHQRYELPEQASLQADSGIIAFLQAQRDRDLHISLRALRRLDTPLVQLLVLAAADWRLRGHDFAVTDLSAAQQAQLDLLGIDQDILPTVALQAPPASGREQRRQRRAEAAQCVAA